MSNQRATIDGGVMIDLAPMKQIRVEPENRRVHAQGGVTWDELNRETRASSNRGRATRVRVARTMPTRTGQPAGCTRSSTIANRLMARRDAAGVRLFTRKGHNWTGRYGRARA